MLPLRRLLWGRQEVSKMAEPTIAGKVPAVQELAPGEYWWCACGKSKKQPFCDGAHKAEGLFTPVSFKIEQTKKVALCMCKRTANKPFCDGSHTKLK
jgi:CDGSH-type Zn-finger protein